MNCENCKGEGLVHQGESIHKVCGVCLGTGKGEEVSSPVSASEPAELVAEPSGSDESFLGEAGEELAPA